MCGIFGMTSLAGRELAHPDRMAAMASLLDHRGPDATHVIRTIRCAFGACRLRIIDPSERADQPFVCPHTGAWLTCNGEIYNAHELRRRFDDYPYRSRSDIEVILAAYRELGMDVFGELDGMFALAIWDPRSASLILARDRAGEKPLFYTVVGRELWFASEVQALLEHPGVSRNVD